MKEYLISEEELKELKLNINIMEVDDLIDELFKSKKPVGTLDRDTVRDMLATFMNEVMAAMTDTTADKWGDFPKLKDFTDLICNLIPQQGTLDRDEVKDIIKKVIEDAAKAKGIKYTFQDMGFFVPIVFTATDQILSLIPQQSKVIAEGICKKCDYKDTIHNKKGCYMFPDTVRCKYPRKFLKTN